MRPISNSAKLIELQFSLYIAHLSIYLSSLLRKRILYFNLPIEFVTKTHCDHAPGLIVLVVEFVAIVLDILELLLKLLQHGKDSRAGVLRVNAEGRIILGQEFLP